MTYAQKWLSKDSLNYGGTPLHFSFDATATGANDALATVVASGYFNTAYNDLRVGDVITIVATDATQIVKVATNTYNPTLGTGAVTVSAGTVIA